MGKCDGEKHGGHVQTPSGVTRTLKIAHLHPSDRESLNHALDFFSFLSLSSFRSYFDRSYTTPKPYHNYSYGKSKHFQGSENAPKSLKSPSVICAGFRIKVYSELFFHMFTAYRGVESSE